MKSARPMQPIPAAELKLLTEQATGPLVTARWRPGRVKGSAATPGAGLVESQEVGLGQIALTIGGDKSLPNEDGVHLLHVVRRGIEIGLFMSAVYEKQVRMDELLRKKRDRQMTPEMTTEFEQKNVTSATILVFCAAYYALLTLKKYKPDVIGGMPIELPMAPEVSLSDPPQALQCFAFYLGRALESDKVSSGTVAVKMAIVYLERVLEELKLRISANALLFTEPFLDTSYKLEDEDFAINGFEVELDGPQVSVTVNPVKFEEVVGNRAAKHNALRSIQRLALFDLKEKKNPYIAAFGKVPLITMGKGMAGTGKTMMAGAEFTELSRIGDNLGFKPLYWELPKDMASEFQGKSAKQMVEWTRRFADTSRIIYGVMDDVEGVLKSIEGNRSAESTEGIISVFLTFSEGATASRELNWLLRLLTNLPEKIYQPVMSRIQDKYDIEGAITVEDFLDQDWIWRQDIAKQDKAFDDMKDPPGDHVYMATQGKLVNLSQLYAREPIEPREGTLRNIFEEVRRTYHEDEHMFYAQVYAKVKAAFPTSFSSRDVRNIQVAINSRRTDFDVDPEWVEKREAFTDKPFDEKVKMLLARQKDALNGLSMKTCRLQETVRYLNALLSIPENARLREVNEMRDNIIKNFDAEQEAKALLVNTGRVKAAEAGAA